LVTNLKFLQILGQRFLWAALRDVKVGPGWIACTIGRIILSSAGTANLLHLQQLQMHL